MPMTSSFTWLTKKLKNSLLLSIWRKLKYQFIYRQPIPIFARKTCPECKIVFSVTLFQKCPLCGWSERTVWVVVWRDQVEGVYKNHRDALLCQKFLYDDSQCKTTIYEMEVE